MKNKQNYPDIREIAKEIIGLRFEKTDTLKSCMDKFFDIMEKYNIKQGTPTFNEEGKENSWPCVNHEWTICKHMFLKEVEDFFEIEFLFGGVPENLLK